MDKATLKKPAENATSILIHPADMLWTKSYSVHKAAIKLVIDVILSEHHGKSPPRTRKQHPHAAQMPILTRAHVCRPFVAVRW